MVHFGEFCGQTVLPDRSLFIGRKLLEMPKLKNSNATFWVIFKHCVVANYLGRPPPKWPKDLHSTLASAILFQEVGQMVISCHKVLLATGRPIKSLSKSELCKARVNSNSCLAFERKWPNLCCWPHKLEDSDLKTKKYCIIKGIFWGYQY